MRTKRKREGKSAVQLWLTDEEYLELAALWLDAKDPGPSFPEYLKSCLFQSARFRYNSGKPKNLRASQDQWITDQGHFHFSPRFKQLLAHVMEKNHRTFKTRPKKRKPGRPKGSRNRKVRASKTRTLPK